MRMNRLITNILLKKYFSAWCQENCVLNRTGI